MSSRDSLYVMVHALFHDAFGEPHKHQGGGEQWTLKAEEGHSSAIHVVLNGTPDRPGVWVFDPHDRHNGVENTPITKQYQAAHLIRQIQERMHWANEGRERPSAALMHERQPDDEPGKSRSP